MGGSCCQALGPLGPLSMELSAVGHTDQARPAVGSFSPYGCSCQGASDMQLGCGRCAPMEGVCGLRLCVVLDSGESTFMTSDMLLSPGSLPWVWGIGPLSCGGPLQRSGLL